MDTTFTSNPKRQVDPPDKADDDNRGARSSDTVYRRLSRLDLGICPDPSITRNSPRPEDSTENLGNGGSGTRTWFVVIDKGGPIADFATWAEAYRYVVTNDVPGCIIRIEEPLDPTDSGR